VLGTLIEGLATVSTDQGADERRVVDSTGKLEMRRYDLLSAGSKLAFFNRGVM